MKFIFPFICISTLLVLNSCKTFYIPVDSFKEQFAGIDSSSLRSVKVRGPVGDKVSYKANPITYVKAVDKNNNPFKIKNSPSLEIRFTDYNNKRTIFYFDRIFVTDSLITGVQSRFISAIRKTIPVNSIKKIEIQDGKKNFHYID
jgi:hypothetical protein